MPATSRVQLGDWYDYPQYFDMIFRDETATEVDFIRAAMKRYSPGKHRRFYEPGCGSGRLVVAMAADGFQVTGSDLSKPSLRYLRNKLRRRKLQAQLVLGDMTTYVTPQSVDGAFCTFNTFRHLMTQEAAISHLTAVARSLRQGGIYILGFHIIPLDADEYCIERWRAVHGKTRVSMTLRVLDSDREERWEQVRISLKATTPAKTFQCRTEFPMRLYTLEQAVSMLAEVPQLELVGVHDFSYDIDQTRELDDELVDAIFILRKRGD